MERSRRLPSALRNFSVGAVTALLSGVVMYMARIVFLSRMDVEYVGYTSLFEHVFILLSSLDLGVTSSLVSFLASTLSEGDEEKARGSLDTTRRIYLAVSVVILASGTLFALLFSSREGKGIQLFLSAVLYFLGQCAQYFYGWRVLALNVEGRNDIVSCFVQGGRILSYGVGTAAVVITGSFLSYSFFSSLFVFLSFLLLHLYSPRILPWIKGKGKKMSGEEERKLFKKLPAMGMHRVGAVFYRAFEMIAVTLLFGAAEGGRYSNLLMVSTALMTVFWIFQSSSTGIVGEYFAKEEKGNSRRLFLRLLRGNFLLSLLLGAGFVVLGVKVAALSFGEGNISSSFVGAAMGMELFLLSSRTSAAVMRDAEGEYSGDWWKIIPEALLAVVSLFFLRPILGAAAVPASISISLLFVAIPLENYIVSEKLEKGSGKRQALSSFILSFAGSAVVFFIWKVTYGFQLG